MKDAAKGLGVYMGASLKEPDLESDSFYAGFAPKHFDLTTPGNACKMVTIAKKGINKSDWDYTECLDFTAYAKKNGMAMRGHNLIWASTGNRNPGWVYNITNTTELENFMIEYITTTIQTIGDYPFAWDAINEAVGDHVVDN